MRHDSSGQSLPDALIALGLLSVTITTVISLNASAYRSTTTANLQSDIASLYSEVAGAISTEPTCRAMIGGSLQATGYPDATPQTFIPGKTNFHLFRSSSSFQGGSPSPTNSSNPILIDPSDTELKKYGKWEVTSVMFNPLTSSSNPSAPAPFQLQIKMQPSLDPTKARTLQFYLSILLGSSNEMISCSSLTFASSFDTVPTCSSTEALTSWDHVRVQCKPFRCATGTPSYDARGDLVCL